jgi:hypothetical protein
MNKNAIYRISWLLIFTGAAWISWNLYNPYGTPILCMFRHVTGIKCPSCGMTSGITSLLHGNINEAFFANPLSIVVLPLILLMIILLISDYLTNRDLYYKLYTKVESILQRQKLLSIFLMLTVIVSWCFILVNSEML